MKTAIPEQWSSEDRAAYDSGWDAYTCGMLSYEGKDQGDPRLTELWQLGWHDASVNDTEEDEDFIS